MGTGAVPVTGVTDLTAAACWELLRASEVGRLAVVADGLPEIFPVNFVVDHGSVVIRTAPGTKLAAAVNGPQVAFEADGYDPEAGDAWSVVLKGNVALRETLQEKVDTAALPLFPWHAMPKPCFVRVVPHTVTGRRFAVVGPSHWSTPVTAALGASRAADHP